MSHFKNSTEESIKQAADSSRVFNIEERRNLNPIIFATYPNSPTAQCHLQAFINFSNGSELILHYKKEGVEDENDCDYLQPAFECIANGHIFENSLFEPFRPPDNTGKLVNQYRKLRPDDAAAEYVNVILIWRRHGLREVETTKLSDYEFDKRCIRKAEKFAHKLQSTLKSDSKSINRRILIDVLYLLGSRYVSSHQLERTLDSFQKCYSLDTTNHSALYGIAYHYKEGNPEKAIQLFLQFVDQAPVCDKQYPNAYYMLASLHLKRYNPEMASKYTELAEDAEKKRLPFLSSVDIPDKDCMQLLKSISKLSLK
jgi:tetratricopeptide (TPR) repeat protein